MRWLRSLFAWETRRDTGVWLYQENAVTGARRIIRGAAHGYQPCDFVWLEGARLGGSLLLSEHSTRREITEQK